MVYWTDQNSKPLEIEDKTNTTLVINVSVIIKNDSLFNSTRDWIIVKGYGFLSFANICVKLLAKP